VTSIALPRVQKSQEIWAPLLQVRKWHGPLALRDELEKGQNRITRRILQKDKKILQKVPKHYVKRAETKTYDRGTN
jgi:hypothetical protein